MNADEQQTRARVFLAKLQGAYDLIGGLWPLLHMDSFEWVTGPKRDEWLVRTVAGILVLLGAVLLYEAFQRKRIGSSLRVLAAGISGVLALVALVSSVGGWISWTYFFDGLIHVSFMAAWCAFHFRSRVRTIS